MLRAAQQRQDELKSDGTLKRNSGEHGMIGKQQNICRQSKKFDRLFPPGSFLISTKTEVGVPSKEAGKPLQASVRVQGSLTSQGSKVRLEWESAKLWKRCYDGTCTEHQCYECWAGKDGHMCFEKDGRCNGDACEFLLGNYVDAVRDPEARSVKKPEEREAKKPWNRNCDHCAFRTAYNAMVENYLRPSKSSKV